MMDLLDKAGLSKMDNKKIILVIITCLIIAYLDFNFFLAFQLKALKTLGPKIIKIKADLDKLDKELINMQDLKNKQAGRSKALSLKAKKVILEEDIPALLKGISDVANINDVKITQMKPAKEPEARAAPAEADKEKLTPLLITLDLIGGYHHLGRFINDLENVETLITVENQRILPGGLADYLKQKASLVLKAYVKN